MLIRGTRRSDKIDVLTAAGVPSGTRLTAFHSDTVKGDSALLQRIIDRVVLLDDVADTWKPTGPLASSFCCRDGP